MDYDIFEIMPDGAPMWKTAVSDRDAALQALESMAETCENELRVVDLSTEVVIATKPPKNGRPPVANP